MTVVGSAGNPLIVGLPALRSAVDAAADHTVHPVTGEPVSLSGKERAELFKLTMAPTANNQWLRTKIVDRMVAKGQLPPEAREMVRAGASIEDLGMLSLRHNLARILDLQIPSATAHAGGVGALADGLEGTLGMERGGHSLHPTADTIYAPDDTPLSRFVARRVAESQDLPFGGVRGQSTVEALDLADDLAGIEESREALRYGMARIAEPDAGGLTPAQRMEVLHNTVARLSATGEAPAVETMLMQQIFDHPDPRAAAQVFEEELVRIVSAAPASAADPALARTLHAEAPTPTPTSPTSADAPAPAPDVPASSAPDAPAAPAPDAPAAPAADVPAKPKVTPRMAPAKAPKVAAGADDVARAAASAMESARVAAEAATIARHAATEAVITGDALMHMDDHFRIAAPTLSTIAARGALAGASQTERTFAALAKALQRL